MNAFELQMEPIIGFLKYLPGLLWALVLGICEWIAPRHWYAKRVDQDVVLITGAGSGLGRAISMEYAKLDAQLILWDINQTGLDETKALVLDEYEKIASNKTCSTYIVDVSDRGQVQRHAQQVHSDLNRGRAQDEPEKHVSVLINNAGIYHGRFLKDLTDEQIERIFKINILSHFWTVRAFLPKMIELERGHIVEIASMGGINGLLKQVDYCATKFATVGFEESLSIELDFLGYGDRIRTTAICPLFFRSNLFTGFNANVSSLMSVEYVAHETVMAMRCNHSRVLLPLSSAYILWVLRTYLPRRAAILMTRALNLDEGIKNIKGTAL